MSKLWFEKHRPSGLANGFIFPSQQMESKVKEWIDKKSIPNLLLLGSAGTGKCLDKSEKIIVKIDTTTLSENQINKLIKYSK